MRLAALLASALVAYPATAFAGVVPDGGWQAFNVQTDGGVALAFPPETRTAVTRALVLAEGAEAWEVAARAVVVADAERKAAGEARSREIDSLRSQVVTLGKAAEAAQSATAKLNEALDKASTWSWWKTVLGLVGGGLVGGFAVKLLYR